MKLIDLLVQELPNRGGWPGSVFAGDMLQLGDGSVSWSYKEGWYPSAHKNSECVRKNEYEAALAASKQVAWDGEGLPPVGCECEIFDCEKWQRFTVKFIGVLVVIANDGENAERVFHIAKKPERFRPIRTEAERKREDAVQVIASFAISYRDAAEIYDAIAAGKIPGIKLDLS